MRRFELLLKMMKIILPLLLLKAVITGVCVYGWH